MNSRNLKIVMSILLIVAVYVATCVFLPASGSNDAGLNEGGSNDAGSGSMSVSQESGRDYIRIDYTDKTVVVDSGHGGIDPGKIGVNGILEKDINLDIAKKLEEKLKSAGVKVVMTRSEDIGHYDENDTNKKRADMKVRCKLIEESGADVVVSIHQNSYTGASVKGAQMFYYEGSQEGKRLAGILQKEFSSQVDATNKRVEKADDSYYMLIHTKAPTVIAECGFLSNPGEAELLSSKEYQTKIANALCTGILEYFNECAED